MCITLHVNSSKCEFHLQEELKWKVKYSRWRTSWEVLSHLAPSIFGCLLDLVYLLGFQGVKGENTFWPSELFDHLYWQLCTWIAFNSLGQLRTLAETFLMQMLINFRPSHSMNPLSMATIMDLLVLDEAIFILETFIFMHFTWRPKTWPLY